MHARGCICMRTHEFGQQRATGRFQQCSGKEMRRKVGHVNRGTHKLHVLSVFICFEWLYSKSLRSLVGQHRSHLLPFALSVKPLIPSIHLPEALSPSTPKPTPPYQACGACITPCSAFNTAFERGRVLITIQ